MTQRYMASGKEVLRNFRHFADCIDHGAAEMIAAALNAADEIQPTEAQCTIPLDGAEDGPLFSRSHHVRQENDEMACSCGKRWDVGEDHP